MIKVGVIGYGYWGPNIVRNFSNVEGCQVVRVCDQNSAALAKVAASYSGMQTTSDSDEIVCATDIDVVAIVTPVSAHYPLCKQALQNGKHVFVEKPFTSKVSESEELVELADRKNLKIMVDHTFLFTGAVRKMKELIANRELGDLYYYDSVRVNLGLFQHDVNVIWDLAPHDLSIMDYLIEEKPEAVVATGERHLSGFEDIAYLTFYFPNNVISHIHVNWLSPVKVRQTLIGGKKRMLVWNDLEADEKVKVYDKGVDIESKEGVYKLLLSYRSGDMWAPKIEPTEALRLEAQHLIDCINSGDTPMNDGRAGLRVVKLLEAATQSLRNRGEMVYV